MYWLSRFILFIFCRVFFRLTVVGRENIPKTGGFLLAPNHSSYLDPPVVGSACPRQVHYMAKKELFSVPLLGGWMRSVGTFPVRRGAVDRSALREAARLLKEGRCVCVFLEGGIVSPGEEKRGVRPGVAFLAKEAGVPVVPAAIVGTNPWFHRIFGFFPWFSRAEVRFGKPMTFQFNETEKMHSKEFQAVARKVLDKVLELQFTSDHGHS